jgi:two-component system, cell cycle sensor histidine kinase and response regulator CckA
MPPLRSSFFLAFAAPAAGSYLLLPPDWRPYAYVVSAFSSATAIFVGAVVNRSERRRAWFLLGTGIVLWAFGDALWLLWVTAGLSVGDIAVPDVVYLAGYPVLFAGAFQLVRRTRTDSVMAVLDAAMIAIVGGVAYWALVVAEALHTTRSASADVYVIAFYPALDTLLLASVAFVFFGTRLVRERSAVFLLVGSAALVVGDAFYALGSANGTYVWGSASDYGFLLFYVMCGAAALDPSMRRVESVEERTHVLMSPLRLGGMAASALVLPVVFSFARLEGSTDDQVFAIAAGLFILAAFARLSLQALMQRRDFRRRLELVEELRASRELYRLLVENSGDMIRVVDFGGRILYASPSHEPVLGLRPEELVGTSVSALYHPDDADAVPRTMEAVHRGETVALAGLRLRGRDRDWLQIEGTAVLLETADGRPLILTTSWDVTDTIRAAEAQAATLDAERALRAQAERGREAVVAMLERMGDAFVSFDAEGRFTYVNAAAEAIFGRRRDDLLGRLRFDVFPAWRDSAIQRLCDLAVTEGRVVQGVEQDAAIDKLVDFTIYPHDGGYDSYFRDVTERRELEQQLLQSQKLEAIGILAGSVAHDFNNLLVAINGYSSLLLGEDLPEEIRHDVAEIQRAGERGAALTRQLLAFSRKQTLRPLVVDLNEQLDDVEGLLRQLLGEDVAFVSKRAAGLWRTVVDPSQIEQVLVNLAVNARDAMPEGGTLAVETLNAELDDLTAAYVGVPAPGDYVVLRVSDSGTGMDEETRRHAFEPFFTTKPAGKGTGLGLSTVYGIARQSGGGVDIESKLGMGTTFSVFLPRTHDGAESAVDGDRRVAPTGSETILVVEDSTEVRDLAAQMLRRQGYGVLVAESSEHALELAHGCPLDLIVTDVVMPRMSGCELVERLIARGCRVPVLFCSGYSHAIVSDALLEGPSRGFLQKPFSLRGLAFAVRELLDAAKVADAA